MPCFDLLNKVEFFLRTGKFQPDATINSKKVTRAASKNYRFKDGSLWRLYRGRRLRVVRSDEEVREILTRYHDNNDHAGQERVVKEILMMYYWVGVTKVVRSWVKACTVCQKRRPEVQPEPPVQSCMAYGCDSSSFAHPQLSFHRFPKQPEQRRRWLAVAQRDEASLRPRSCLCSRHFEASCFSAEEAGQLRPDAEPTIAARGPQDDEDEDFLHSNTLVDLLSTAAAADAAAESAEPPFCRAAPATAKGATATALQEHQYCLPAPEPSGRTNRQHKKPEVSGEATFRVYDQIHRYLSHRIVSLSSKISRGSLRRMSKRFALIDGVLMYTRISPPVKVPRSREEVDSILRRFHDEQGHPGHGVCQREIAKHFYWSSLTRDLARWVASCSSCLNRSRRKWLRCSVASCTNCCGPVERGLGLTFHKFPLSDGALLAQWLAAVGRPSWHPRLNSSVCSAHFADDCFDRSGEKVALVPGAVPSLLVHGGAAVESSAVGRPAVIEEIYFAKYDAVELYLRTRTYPARLSYVEKNTFRRFCKKFTIKDDKLQVFSGERLCAVLRSKEEVEAALRHYHDDLNHLDVAKCLRLLNERFFWKTMRGDVVRWVGSCSQCSRLSRGTAGEQRGAEPAGSPRTPDLSDCEMESGEDGDSGSERRPAGSSEGRPLRSQLNLRLVAPAGSQKGAPLPLTPGVWTLSISSPRPDFHNDASGLHLQPHSHNGGELVEEAGEEVLPGVSGSEAHQHQNQTHVRNPEMAAGDPQPPESSGTHAANVSGRPWRSCRAAARRRGRGLEGARTSWGMEPLVVRSSKPWPVFTATGSLSAQAGGAASRGDKPGSAQKPRQLQARTVLQQCSRAKVKIRSALGGAEAQWVEIQEGMVVYVCFFQGASEDVVYHMANTLLTTKLFRKDPRHTVSVLDLPGSVLLVPQDSLLGEPAPGRRMRYEGGCEPWRGAQLFSLLAAACRQLLAAGGCRGGGRVELGVYGQRQEMEVSSPEPLTVLLEF